MTIQIALLRGVNVGGRSKVAMPDLRAMLTGLGLTEPRTLLQTGNLIFRGDGRSGRELENTLERAAANRLGLRTDILVRTADEWAGIVASNPFPDEAARDPSRLVVMALKVTPSERAIDELRSAIKGPEIIHAADRRIYIVYPAGINRSKLTNALIEARLGTRGTGRNWNTVRKLAERTQARGG